MYTTLHAITTHQAFKSHNFGDLWITIDDGLVLDFARSVGVAQCTQCLLHVGVCRTAAGDHHGVRVAAQ